MMSTYRILAPAVLFAALGAGYAVAEEPAAGAAAQGHAAAPAQEHKPHWAYEGDTSPEHWGGLATEFKTCAAGKSQSPIDISTATVTALSNIEIHYNSTPLNVVNNGHTIQQNIAEGSFIKVGDTQYDLKQFHFHAPSEHTIGGKSYPLEVHFVHKTAEGKLGVIGVMLEAGAENTALKPVLDNMPKNADETVKKDDVSIDLAAILPADKVYFNYSGSLTTPPCSEGVNWMAMIKPVSVSDAQVAGFTALFPKNNRPVQPVNGRVVSLSN